MSSPSLVEHRYGPRVHLHGDPWSLTALARLGSTQVRPTELFGLLRTLYGALAQRAFSRELPTVEQAVPTRMAAAHRERAVWRGEGIDPAARVVVVDVMRGGILPAQVCFELLNLVLPSESVRLDHLGVARRCDDDGRILGAEVGARKVGGSTEGTIVVLPDPMGATGSTARAVLDHLTEHHGRPARVVCLPLIATPEYLRATLDRDERVVVHAYRIDRGMSSPEILGTVPGSEWERERGIDDQGYIVPGAGGLGEVLNNSWC